jgi:hypothetical protein
MKSTKKLVAGVGINDADYVTQRTERRGDGSSKLIWICPYYRTWKSMLVRCYSKKFHATQPTYKGCTVCDDWKYFSNFKLWMEQQDWKGKQLDKDFLVAGNKVYSSNTCMFISQSLNKTLALRGNDRGTYPVGAKYSSKLDRYIARLSINSHLEHLGVFQTPMEAHRAWQLAKIKVLDDLKDSQPDFLVKIGLQRIIDKIQDDYDNNRETVDFN